MSLFVVLHYWLAVPGLNHASPQLFYAGYKANLTLHIPSFLIDALKLDKANIDLLIQKDLKQQQNEFEEWVNTPIKWHLIIRWMSAVYGEKDIPGNIKTEDEASEYAAGVVKELKKIVWLVLSRRVNYHIDKDRNIKSRNIETIDCSWLPGARLK